GRIDAQAVEDAGELDGDVAAAGDDDPLRQLGDMERLVGGDGVLDPGQVLRHPGPAAGGDQDLVGRDLAAPLDLDRVAVHEAGLAVHQLGAGVLQVTDIDAGKPGDLLVLFGQEGGPVEPRALDRPAVAFGGL